MQGELPVTPDKRETTPLERPATLLVTGGAGFIGSRFVRFLLHTYREDRVLNLDKLTYAGRMENLAEVKDNPRHVFLHGDICDAAFVAEVFARYQPDAVIHFAAESHVDRSISDPQVFLRTNVLGTQTLLDACRLAWQPGSAIHVSEGIAVEADLPTRVETSLEDRAKSNWETSLYHKFLQISTDEVYGALGDEGAFTEQSVIAPNSPYAASKASADLMVRAYQKTFGLKTNITRCSNNYGPNQHPEKLIPLMIHNAMANKPLPVYGDGLQVRDWLYVDDHCSAIDTVLRRGRTGDVYNVGGNNEQTNLALVRQLLALLGKPESLISHVTDRPGHDRRYAIDATKICDELGWRPTMNFAEGLRHTVNHYLQTMR